MDGVIDLADPASAVDDFNKLLRALAAEAGGSNRIGWVVSGVDYSSTVLSASPQARDPEAESLIGGIVHDFLDIARHAWDEPTAGRPAGRRVRPCAHRANREERARGASRDGGGRHRVSATRIKGSSR